MAWTSKNRYRYDDCAAGTLAAVKRLKDAGRCNREIATELGLCVQQVRRCCRRLGFRPESYSRSAACWCGRPKYPHQALCRTHYGRKNSLALRLWHRRGHPTAQVLCALEFAPSTVNELAAVLRLTPANVRIAVDRLAAAGRVRAIGERLAEDDRRTVPIWALASTLTND